MPGKHSKASVRSYVQSLKGGRSPVIEDEQAAIIERAAANGVRGSDGVTAYGEASAYPLHGGGYKVSDRVQAFADGRVAEAKRQKAAEQPPAVAAHGAQGAAPADPKADAARQQSQAINENRRAELAKKHEVHERYKAAETFATEWEADNARKAKAVALQRLASAPKVSSKSLNQFDPAVSVFADQLHTLKRNYPDDEKIAEFVKEARKAFDGMFSAFDRNFQAGVKVAKDLQKQASGAGSMSASSGGVDLDDVVGDMMRDIHAGQTHAISGRGASAAGDFSAAYSDAVLAHQNMVSAAQHEQAASRAVQGGATRIIDLLHNVETGCESVMNFVDAAVTGGKIAAIFPTIVDSIEAGVSTYEGQEHKTLQELGMGLAIDLIFHLLDRNLKDPVTEDLKRMLETEVRKLSKGVVKQIVWTHVYTAAASGMKTALKAIATAYFDQVNDPTKPWDWKKVAAEIYQKWQQDFVTDQASIISGLKG